jgi:hypothetical protein
MRVFSLIILVMVGVQSFSQSITISPEISWKKWYTHLEYIGEIDGNYYVHQRNDDGWDGRLYKLDSKLNVVSTKKLDNKYFSNLGDLFTKRFLIIGDHLIATYVARQKRAAVLCYDEFSTSDLSDVSNENVLLKHEYGGFFHERMIQYRVLPAGDFAYISYKAWDLKEEKAETGVLKIGSELNVVFDSKYAQKDLIGTNAFFREGRLNEKKDFQFANEDAKAHKMGLCSINEKGEFRSKNFDFGDQFFFQSNMLKSGDGLINVGVYAEAFNVDMRGVYIADERSDDVRMFSFGELSGAGNSYVEGVNRNDITVEAHEIGDILFLVVSIHDYTVAGRTLLIKYDPQSKEVSSAVFTDDNNAFGHQESYVKDGKLNIISEWHSSKGKSRGVRVYTVDSDNLTIASKLDFPTQELGNNYLMGSQTAYPRVYQGNPPAGCFGSFENTNKGGRFYIIEY